MALAYMMCSRRYGRVINIVSVKDSYRFVGCSLDLHV